MTSPNIFARLPHLSHALPRDAASTLCRGNDEAKEDEEDDDDENDEEDDDDDDDKNDDDDNDDDVKDRLCLFSLAVTNPGLK